jgi:hypothetical protein
MRAALVAFALAAAAGAAFAQDAQTVAVRSLAASCAQCHGTDGHPVPGSTLPVGDAIQLASLMPKSGHMANNHAKVAAAAIVCELSGWELDPEPMLTNTCYSFVDAKNVIHVSSVHRYDPVGKTFRTVAGSAGVSSGPSELEGAHAWSWARNVWADALS